jgi:Zn-dependent protease
LPAFLFFSTGGRFAIGMAKPVPVNYGNLRSPRLDSILVAVAGPLANILLASVLTFFYHLWSFEPLLYAVYFNLGLAVFNLIPIPPLDGSRILAALLPSRLAAYYDLLERFGFLIVLGLYFLGFLWMFVLPGVNFFARLLDVPQLAVR